MANRAAVAAALVSARTATADVRAARALYAEALTAFRAAKDAFEAPDADGRTALELADLMIAMAAADRQYAAAQVQLDQVEALVATRLAAAKALAAVP